MRLYKLSKIARKKFYEVDHASKKGECNASRTIDSLV
jgi:hypothetical protein